MCSEQHPRACQVTVEIKRPDDQRNRYLGAAEIAALKATLDEKMFRNGGNAINPPFFRVRLVVLVALTTGIRVAEIFGLKWGDLLYQDELIAVRAKLKGGKMRYVPMPPELAAEFRSYAAVLGEERIFPLEVGAVGGRQRSGVGRESIRALRRFSTWLELQISGSTTYGTRSPVGT